jgi:nucleoid-associated protein YgaU
VRRAPTRPRRACALALAALCAGAPAAGFSSHAAPDPASLDADALDDAAFDEAAAAGPPGAPARTREVAPGDTLWSIAAAALGDGTLWAAVYRANRDRIKDPARIYPGQQLLVPEVEPAAMAAVRREGAALAAD